MLFDPSEQDVLLLPIQRVSTSNLPIFLVAVLGTLSWLIVGLRIFTRAYILRSFGWDDATMIIALVSLSHRQKSQLSN
jgi:hypothetical protein